MKYKQIEILSNIHLFVFQSAYDLAMTFIRIQEFYECPSSRFYKKYFSLENFIDWYCKNKTKKLEFSYADDFVGFNVTGKALLEWDKTYEGKYRDKESEVFGGIISNWSDEQIMNSSFIGVSRTAGYTGVVKHEIAHALYYLNAGYRKKMKQLISQIPKRQYKVLQDQLKKWGYHKKVWKDEIQALLSTEHMQERFPRYRFAIENKFSSLFLKYYSGTGRI